MADIAFPEEGVVKRLREHSDALGVYHAEVVETIEGTADDVSAGGTLANGAETAVSSSAVMVMGANPNRKKLIVQNTGANNVRVGVAGVTATTGLRLTGGASVIFDMPDCPTNAIFAIREAADSTVLTQDVT